MLDSFKIDDFQIGDSQNPPHDTIYLATPRQISSSYTKEIYAIKVVTFQNPTSFQKNEANLKHYCQSIRLAYLLKPEGYAKSENQLFIFMEKMKCDLHSIIQNRVQKELYFTSEELKLFLKQMTLTLEELEKKSFPHSNLKPCNILQTMQGMYKMSDVGLQSMNEDSDYKAPELMNFPSKNLNLNYHKCDVFSLGMILLQMASLKSSKELQIFKSNSPDAFRNIENIFNDVKNRYGRIFQKILKDMLVLSDTNRKSITQMREDLEEYYVLFVKNLIILSFFNRITTIFLQLLKEKITILH